MKHNNWQKTINEINRNKYTIPDGWDSKEKVAQSLQCAPERVADILKPGIQSGDIEKQDFPVWDDKRRMTVRVACYRIASQEGSPQVGTARVASKLEERIKAIIERHPDWDDVRVAKSISGVKKADVAALR